MQKEIKAWVVVEKVNLLHKIGFLLSNMCTMYEYFL
jgi:hypothetical protein